ncbi:hypothetical protein ACE6H2_006173 [Prunus campanulata]
MLHLRFPIFAVFAIIGVVFSDEIRVAVGQLCGGDVGGLIRQCSTYVEKGKPMTNPSQACCDLIKKVDILCACKHVTKELEELVDMNKVVHVVSYCGIPVLQFQGAVEAILFACSRMRFRWKN